MSSADKALYDRAKQSGTVFKSREEAAASFKKQYATEFKSTFPKEPPVRPAYIPQTYSYPPGHSTTVVYNPRYGGYGYWSGGGPDLGTWMMYDILSDAAMSQRVYAQKGYYVGEAPSSTALGIFIWIIVLIVIAFAFAAFVASRRM